ncbi:MAG: hypothetical protein HGA65_06785 [Oscillochloris sp.]|nr:hypothetical protein [Oscillochloris sp.]
MNEQQSERLLRSIVAAAQVPGDDLDLTRAQEQLGAYVEHELAGMSVEELARRFPAVAYLIMTDPDFAALYADLRDLLREDDQHTLPDVQLDPNRLRVRPDAPIRFTSEDVARPHTPQPTPTDIDQFRLLGLLPRWERTLPRYNHAYMSGDDEAEDTFIALIPEQSVETHVDVVISYNDDRADFDGRVRPLRPELVGNIVRLYQIVLNPGPSIIVAADTIIDRLGRFMLANVASGRYVLAAIIDDKILGVGWFDLN